MDMSNVPTSTHLRMSVWSWIRNLGFGDEMEIDDIISLKSSDNMVCRMDKTAASTKSEVLKDLIDSTGGEGEIPVPISGDVISKLISFCNKQVDIRKLLRTITDGYKDWVTGFVNANQAILPDLRQAADFLNIPSLLDLTSRVVGDMMGRTLEEISDTYAKLSFTRMLYSLGIGEEVRNNVGIPGPWYFD